VKAEEVLKKLLPHFRGEARLLALLALKGGEVSLEEAMEASDLKEEALLEVLHELETRGAVEVAGEKVRAAAKEEKKRAGAKRRPPSPTERLAALHPHVKGLLLQAGRQLPRLAQPLAAKAPEVLLRACEAASAYGPRRGLSVLLAWLPEVDAWTRALGGEAVAGALEEAAKQAERPFPYAKKLLVSRFGSLEPREAPEEEEERERLYF